MHLTGKRVNKLAATIRPEDRVWSEDCRLQHSMWHLHPQGQRCRTTQSGPQHSGPGKPHLLIQGENSQVVASARLHFVHPHPAQVYSAAKFKRGAVKVHLYSLGH